MRRRSLFTILAAALLVVPLSACTAGQSGSSEDRSLAPQDAAVDSSVAESSGAEPSGAEAPVEAKRSVIHTGEISIVVQDPEAGASEVVDIAKNLDGYVESQTVTDARDGRPASADVSMRVPTESIDAAFTALGEVGDVTTQSHSAEDVTSQHVDLQARVAALDASVKRLTELMQGSASTGELIEAESALSERQQELDGLKAQLESLEGQVSLASISVSLDTQPTALPGGPGNFWEGLVAGFNSMMTAGSGALVVFGVLLPWLVVGAIVALAVIFIVRAAKRRR